MEEREVTAKTALKHLLWELKKMNNEVEYLEDKSRQNNVTIYQVKEGAEGDNMVDFIKTLVTEKLGIRSEQLLISTAHRSLIKKPTNRNVTPRSIVVHTVEHLAKSTTSCLGKEKDSARRKSN